MDNSAKLSETSLPELRFCSHLKVEDTTDADYTDSKRFCKDFKIKN